jgi:GNAT superfamily N-acetyltransferase
MAPTVRLARLAADQWARLRDLRVRALRDAPDAFGATLDDALARSPEEWAAQIENLPTFVAVRDGADVGMVRLARDSARGDTAWLISMWVAPEARRGGVGTALVDAAMAWARADGRTRLLLDVADHNGAAIAFYARLGFAPNGVTSTMPPPRQHVREHQRERRLAAAE